MEIPKSMNGIVLMSYPLHSRLVKILVERQNIPENFSTRPDPTRRVAKVFSR